MRVLVLIILLQVALIVHIIKTNRNTIWVWIVIALPLAGSIAYIIVEVLPGALKSKTGRKVQEDIKNVLNPNDDINTAADNYSTTDSVINSTKLAEECINKNMFAEAKKLFEKSLTGIYENSPDIMYGLARSEFGLENYSRVKEILDELIAHNPEFKNEKAHLLFALTAEKLNNIPLAIKEFEVLDGYYSGPEASFRYALLLKKEGQKEKANSILEKIIDKAKISGDLYNTRHKKWISQAQSELSTAIT